MSEEYNEIINREIARIKREINRVNLVKIIEEKEKLKQEKKDFGDSGHKRVIISKED